METAAPAFTPPVRTAIRLRHADQLFIDGRWVAPKLGGRIEVHSPYNEQHLATVAEASEADMDAAVAAARKAFDQGPWPRLSPVQRAGYLQQLAGKLAERQAELCSAWTDQVGAVSMLSPFMIGGGLGALAFYAAQAETFPFVEQHPPFDGIGAARVAHEAVGVVAAIVPWNAPFMILVNKIAPALLAGCTVLMKPSPETPLEAYLIAEAAEDIGLPPGVLNLLPAHREASDHLVRNPGVDKVSFTGSTIAGKRIASVCGERIGRCALELGGKSAAILLDDADFDAAAKILAQTISIMSGQVCATLSRVVVPKARHARLAEAIAAEMRTIRVGNPWEPGVMMGPLAMKRQLERVQDYLRIGVSEGARLAFGGDRPAGLDQGHYLSPTLFTDVKSDMRIAQEEIFGPVLALLPYDDEADAIRIANDSPFGLFGAVFTPDNDRAYRVARQVRTGALSQNAFRLDPILPFGGFKQSGIGREGGLAGLRAYLETKTILLDGAPSAD